MCASLNDRLNGAELSVSGGKISVYVTPGRGLIHSGQGADSPRAGGPGQGAHLSQLFLEIEACSDIH